jgi:hypothetical protein
LEKYNSAHKAFLDNLLLNLPQVRSGKMFGFPAYYVGKKICICLYGQGVGVKLPEPSAKKLLELDQNVIPFQPYGRQKMRLWVQINLTRSEDYRQYMPVFEESIQHVLAEAQEGEG